MKTLFDANDRQALLARIARLQAETAPLWGKMNAAQAVRHCGLALSMATGDAPSTQSFLGKIITPFIRKSVLGEKPFSRNSPTDPKLKVADDRDLASERDRLAELIARFVERGPAEAGKATHSFFGKLSGDEWGCLMYKHIDHHLQQFGV